MAHHLAIYMRPALSGQQAGRSTEWPAYLKLPKLAGMQLLGALSTTCQHKRRDAVTLNVLVAQHLQNREHGGYML